MIGGKRHIRQRRTEREERIDELLAIGCAQHTDDAKRPVHVSGQPVQHLGRAILDGGREREDLSRRDEVAELPVDGMRDISRLLQCGLLQPRTLTNPILPQQEGRKSQNRQDKRGRKQSQIGPQ